MQYLVDRIFHNNPIQVGPAKPLVIFQRREVHKQFGNACSFAQATSIALFVGHRHVIADFGRTGSDKALSVRSRQTFCLVSFIRQSPSVIQCSSRAAMVTLCGPSSVFFVGFHFVALGCAEIVKSLKEIMCSLRALFFALYEASARSRTIS